MERAKIFLYLKNHHNEQLIFMFYFVEKPF